MSNDDEYINFWVTDGIKEPLLFDHCLNWVNDGIVVVAGKVKEKGEGCDTNSLVLCDEFAEVVAERDELSSIRSVNVDIRNDISFL